MRRFAFLIALLALPVAASAQLLPPLSEVDGCDGGFCTRAAPTCSVQPYEGFSLLGVHGFNLMTCANSGSALAGTGSLQLYRCDSFTGLPTRVSDLDLNVTATTRCQSFIDFALYFVTYWPDTLVVAPASVGISDGGTSLTVYFHPYSGSGY